MIDVDVARGNIDRPQKDDEAHCTTSENERILAGAVDGPDKTSHEEVISRRN